MLAKNQGQRIIVLEQQVAELIAGQSAMLQGQIQIEARLESKLESIGEMLRNQLLSTLKEHQINTFSKGVSCSTSTQIAAIPKTAKKSIPRNSSSSHTDVGPHSTNEDQHIQIDDLCNHLGFQCSLGEPTVFYARFYGHGGPGATAFMRNNAMKFFFEVVELPQASDIDKKFLLS